MRGNERADDLARRGVELNSPCRFNAATVTAQRKLARQVAKAAVVLVATIVAKIITDLTRYRPIVLELI